MPTRPSLPLLVPDRIRMRMCVCVRVCGCVRVRSVCRYSTAGLSTCMSTPSEHELMPRVLETVLGQEASGVG